MAMVQVAFLGFDIGIDADTSLLSSLSFWQSTDYLVLTGFNYLFMLMTNTLMLNLLIAMLSNTYHDALTHADQTWRIDRARRVLRLELLQEFLFGRDSIILGAQVMGPGTPYFHGFKGFAPNPEGRNVIADGGGNPFDGEHGEKFEPTPFRFAIADHPVGFSHAGPRSTADQSPQPATRQPSVPEQAHTIGVGFTHLEETPPGMQGWPTGSTPRQSPRQTSPVDRALSKRSAGAASNLAPQPKPASMHSVSAGRPPKCTSGPALGAPPSSQPQQPSPAEQQRRHEGGAGEEGEQQSRSSEEQPQRRPPPLPQQAQSSQSPPTPPQQSKPVLRSSQAGAKPSSRSAPPSHKEPTMVKSPGVPRPSAQLRVPPESPSERREASERSVASVVATKRLERAKTRTSTSPEPRS